MLAATGIISDADRDALLGGLERVQAELDDGSFPFARGRRGHPHGDRAAADRDRRPGRRQAAHRALAQRPGRHRHGDVHPRARAADGASGSSTCRACWCSVAERHVDWAMPGYTHLQRAQPVYLSHHLLAYFWMFRRDARRFEFVLGATSELPLGAGALAGVNFATDRRLVARRARLRGRRRRTRSTPSPTATSCSTSWPRPPPARPTSRGSARRSCCGRRRSSASARSPTRGRRARRSCRRRRTRTPPSCCAARRRASSPASPRCTACCTASRSPTTRTCRRTRSSSSTPSTRSTSACRRRRGCSRGSPSTASGSRRPPPTS